MKIDFKEYGITIKDEIIYLTKTENILLELLYKNKDDVARYEEITKLLYGLRPDKYLRNLTKKHMSLLRKKIKKYIKIRNIKGVGYILEEDNKE